MPAEADVRAGFKPAPISNFPHIRSERTVPGFFWTLVAALLPATLFRCVLYRGDGFRALTVVITSAVLTELLAGKWLRKRPGVYDGSSVSIGLLIFQLLPPYLLSWHFAAAGFLAIFLGREIFGGLGQNPFHPSVVGAGLLWMFHPQLPDFSNAHPVLLYGEAVCLFLGGIFLIVRKLAPPEIPFIYLGTVLALSWIFNRPAVWSGEEIRWGVLAGFFLITDSVASPVTRQGKQIFSLAAGIFTALFGIGSGIPGAVLAGVLLSNALIPQIDGRVRPAGARKRKK